jgi:acyl-CoA reductase-like NAD-dependent aldehyde dehydrogenase
LTIIRCISPIDGSVYAERRAIGLEEARDAIASARVAQRTWRKRPLEERIALVRAGIARLNDMKDDAVPELAWQMGRPVRYGGEFKGVNERADYMMSIAVDALAPIVIEESHRFTRRVSREPHGIVLVIAPWNYPYMTVINTLVPALIAGNCVILKHASQTLLVGERMVRAFVEAGVPSAVFQNLVLDHESTLALIADGQFDCINFTGSVAGGQAIERAAAGTFTAIGLELGGKDPAYVMEDAALDAAVDGLMDAVVFNSGQSCCGIERIYVAEPIYDEFLDKCISWLLTQRLGNPLDPQTTLGPMATLRGANTVRRQIEDALAHGARALIDPKLFPADDGKGTYVLPQILVGVDHSMEFMRDETFGPAVGVMKVRNDTEALALMNDSAFGLSASLWTSDPEKAARLGGEIETGTVFLNRADYLDPALCWTGVKDTGRGGSLSVVGFHNLTRPKSYHLKKALS